MDQDNEIKLPYKEWYKIQDVAQKLNCSIDDLIFWNSFCIDLYIDAESLYGELTIFCDKKAPAIKKYNELQNSYYKEFKERYPNYDIDEYAFSASNLIDMLPFENRNKIKKMRRRYARSGSNPFFMDKSDDNQYCIKLIYSGSGHWKIPNRLDDYKINLYSNIDNVYYIIDHLELNREFYNSFDNWNGVDDGLYVKYYLYEKILISKYDLMVRVNDYNNLIKGNYTEQRLNGDESKLTVGKPSHFYKNFAINSAIQTRDKFPHCKVSNLARKLFIKIANEFNATTPPTEETIANWLYEIKLGKPKVRSNDEFELVIPDEWVDYSE